MKTLWIFGLLSLLAIVAFSRTSVVVGSAAEPRSIAAPTPSPDTPVGIIARDESSGGLRKVAGTLAIPAPGSTNNDNHAKLSAYLFLHETRNVSSPLQAAARANVCPN